jgi:hypothetical protein
MFCCGESRSEPVLLMVIEQNKLELAPPAILYSDARAVAEATEVHLIHIFVLCSSSISRSVIMQIHVLSVLTFVSSEVIHVSFSVCWDECLWYVSVRQTQEYSWFNFGSGFEIARLAGGADYLASVSGSHQGATRWDE